MSGAHLTVQNLTTGYHGFQVLQDLALAPAWMRPLLREVARVDETRTTSKGCC